MMQWQAIETAPKDGIAVLLYRPGMQFVGYWGGNFGWVINAPGLPIIYPLPTHWMPLPEMPKKEGENDGKNNLCDTSRE